MSSVWWLPVQEVPCGLVNLRQRREEVLAFGVGEVRGDGLLDQPSFGLDRFL
jgi:hypothetical protein